jgi:hypothetical protein
MPEWHSTFNRMRHMTRRRDWMTWGEFQGRLNTLGVSLSAYHVRVALRASPPSRTYGLKRYQDRHVQMAVGYARAKGLVVEAAPEPEEVTA